MTTALHRRADAAARATRAWTLRVAGATWAEVCEVVGFTDEGNAVRAVRRYYGKLPTIDHEELRSLWRDRHEVLWRQSQEAVSKGQPGALRAGVAVARSASQLDGLDKPSQIAIYRPDETEFMQTVAALRAAALAGLPAEGDPFAIEPPESV